jgi:hypothetical protein
MQPLVHPVTRNDPMSCPQVNAEVEPSVGGNESIPGVVRANSPKPLDVCEEFDNSHRRAASASVTRSDDADTATSFTLVRSSGSRGDGTGEPNTGKLSPEKHTIPEEPRRNASWSPGLRKHTTSSSYAQALDASWSTLSRSRCRWDRKH